MKKSFAVCSLVGLAVLGLSTPAYAEKPHNSDMNKADYWATSGGCAKVELEDGVKWYVLPDMPSVDEYRLVIIKAGTVHEEVRHVVTPGTQVSATSGKDISHVIYCWPEESDGS